MAAIVILCLIVFCQDISAQICGCTSFPQATFIPLGATEVVDNSVVQSLVDTIQLCVASNVVQNHLNAPPTVKLSKFPPTTALPGVKCKPEITCADKLLPVISCDVPCVNSNVNCACNCNPCRCNPCNCKKCKDILPPCLDALICGNCHCNPCCCNKCCQELILPPLVPQLPCGCGYLSAAAPLVTSAYGAFESCLSPLGSCVEAYIPGSIPVVEPLLSCGCGHCNCGCSPCTSATISTPLCRELTRLAQPVIL